MKNVIAHVVLMSCVQFQATNGCYAADTTRLSIDFGKTNQLDCRKLENGEVELKTLGEDPFLVLNRFDSKSVSSSQTILAFEYFCPEGVEGLTVFYGPPITGTKQFAAGRLGQAESWVPHAVDLNSLSGGKWTTKSNQMRLDLGRRKGVILRIRNLQLRQPTEQERRTHEVRETERREKLKREARINAFFEAKFSCSVDDVIVRDKSVVIRGQSKGQVGKGRLIEIRPEISIADDAAVEATAFVLEQNAGIREAAEIDQDGKFEFSIPRHASGEAGVDRSTSRWAVAESLPKGRWKLLSPWKYATKLAAKTDLPRLTPKSIKGMGGISPHLPLEELVELGVHNITMNTSLTGLMDVTPHRGWLPFKHGGRMWYVHPQRIASYDKVVGFASKNDIVVSATLLVSFSNSAFGKLIVHPEADRAGQYAMPNFTDAKGVAAYEAVIEFLAQRYSGREGSPGRIANWIIHNEVGFGWVWTNMGKQPPMLYMDHYLRSMRLVHNVTRRHDPHARVFISLTHHWNTPTEPSWRSYSNLELIERLVKSSRVEGDFAWGIAFHPYPQNLRKADAWNDTRATDAFDTPMITPKNIAVLDRWMHTPKMRDAEGNVRSVLLSEQGFNTRDYSIEEQRLQAAGLVYMWRQMRGLESIEAFHNHRWVDHAREGGLLLGLRKLPVKGRWIGEKKLSWDVYKALGTSTQDEVTQFADDIINGQ